CATTVGTSLLDYW
nr:immunoglobulin heavy chain junction region [Macaca mulatta]